MAMTDAVPELTRHVNKRRPRPPRVTDSVAGVWTTDKYGNHHPPPLVDRFLDWLCDPYRNPNMSQAGWAKSNGVKATTLSRWLRDERVKGLLEKRFEVLNAEPTRVQQVVQAVYERALLGDVKAATLYLQYVDKLAPKRIVVHEARELKSMSDDQLREQLQKALYLLDQPGRGTASIPGVIDVEEGHALEPVRRVGQDQEGQDPQPEDPVDEDG
jgi:hypothetical protein